MVCSICNSDVNVKEINLYPAGSKKDSHIHGCRLCVDCRRLVVNFIRDMKHLHIRTRKIILAQKGTAFEAPPATEED